MRVVVGKPEVNLAQPHRFKLVLLGMPDSIDFCVHTAPVALGDAEADVELAELEPLPHPARDVVTRTAAAMLTALRSFTVALFWSSRKYHEEVIPNALRGDRQA